MPHPISFETIDDLEIIWHDLCAVRRICKWKGLKGFPSINEKIAVLCQANDEALVCVEKALEEARAAVVPASTDLSGVEGERVGEFDSVLRKLTNLLERECARAQAPLDACLAEPSDPMADFEVDVRIDYLADEHTPGYSEDSDNRLTFRDYPMRRRHSGEPCVLSGEWGASGQESSHCWLFHDLTEHYYGLTQPAVPTEKIYAIGQVWADVVVRRQYLLDTRTGNWVRP